MFAITIQGQVFIDFHEYHDSWNPGKLRLRYRQLKERAKALDGKLGLHVNNNFGRSNAIRGKAFQT